MTSSHHQEEAVVAQGEEVSEEEATDTAEDTGTAEEGAAETMETLRSHAIL